MKSERVPDAAAFLLDLSLFFCDWSSCANLV